MSLSISKIGTKLKVVKDGQTFYPNISDVDVSYADDKISVVFAGHNFSSLPIADVTLEGEEITDQESFEAQLAILFANVLHSTEAEISTNITTDAASDVKAASPKAVKTYVDAEIEEKFTDAVSDDVVIDGVGTLTFTNGVLTAIVPE